MAKTDLYQDKAANTNTVSDSNKLPVFDTSTSPATRDMVDATVLKSYFGGGGGGGSGDHVIWEGGYSPLAGDDYSDVLPQYEDITTTNLNIGTYNVHHGFVIGTYSAQRGQLYWQDTNGIADPRRTIFQFGINSVVGSSCHFVIGFAVNNQAVTSGYGWRYFDRGILIAFHQHQGNVSGSPPTMVMMGNQDGFTADADDRWYDHTARTDAGSWSLSSNFSDASYSSSSSDAEQNARVNFDLPITSINGLDLAIEQVGKQTRVYRNKQLFATWTWSTTRYPFRTGKDVGAYYMVRSTSGNLRTYEGSSRSPATYIDKFAVSSASRTTLNQGFI